jgi:hypothetical protein
VGLVLVPLCPGLTLAPPPPPPAAGCYPGHSGPGCSTCDVRHAPGTDTAAACGGCAEGFVGERCQACYEPGALACNGTRPAFCRAACPVFVAADGAGGEGGQRGAGQVQALHAQGQQQQLQLPCTAAPVGQGGAQVRWVARLRVLLQFLPLLLLLPQPSRESPCSGCWPLAAACCRCRAGTCLLIA